MVKRHNEVLRVDAKAYGPIPEPVGMTSFNLDIVDQPAAGLGTGFRGSSFGETQPHQFRKRLDQRVKVFQCVSKHTGWQFSARHFRKQPSIDNGALVRQQCLAKRF